jgi:hypothetical protein
MVESRQSVARRFVRGNYYRWSSIALCIFVCVFDALGPRLGIPQLRFDWATNSVRVIMGVGVAHGCAALLMGIPDTFPLGAICAVLGHILNLILVVAFELRLRVTDYSRLNPYRSPDSVVDSSMFSSELAGAFVAAIAVSVALVLLPVLALYHLRPEEGTPDRFGRPRYKGSSLLQSFGKMQ